MLYLSKTNIFGSQVEFQNPVVIASAGPPETVQLVALAGDIGDAGPWTITLSGPTQTLVAGVGIQFGAGLPDLFARITYGVGDSMQIVDVDWCHGAQITVFGSNINVQAVNPYNRPPAVKVGLIAASLSPGVRPDGRPNQRTIRFNETGQATTANILPGETREIAIPQMARRVRHSCVSSASLPRTLQLLDPLGNVLSQYSYANSTGRIFPQWAGGDMIDIPRSASRVAITNADGALQMASVHCVFDLAV